MDATPFDSVFALESTLVPEQSDSLPIVRISGMDSNADGLLLVSDASEGNAKVFDAQGRIVRVLGRKGFGPSEFQAPFAPRFGPDGRIHIPDARLKRVSIYDAQGTFRAHVPLSSFARIADFEVLPSGGYLVTGFQGSAGRNVLFQVDSTGRVRAEHLPLSATVPEGERNVPQWQTVRRPSVAVWGDQAVVAEAISDSLWSVDLRTGRVASAHLQVPGYVRPSLPRGGLRDLPAVTAWSRSFTMAATVLRTNRFTLVPFVKGRITDGDPVTATLQRPDGRWVGLENGPAIIGVTRDDRVVAIRDPNAERVALSFYRLKE